MPGLIVGRGASVALGCADTLAAPQASRQGHADQRCSSVPLRETSSMRTTPVNDPRVIPDAGMRTGKMQKDLLIRPFMHSRSDGRLGVGLPYFRGAYGALILSDGHGVHAVLRRGLSSLHG